MSDVTVPYNGWGRGTWNQLAWGEGSVTNAGAQGIVGSVEITADAGFSVGGLPATGQVSAVTVNAEVDATPEGVSGTGSVGSVTIIPETFVSLTGVTGQGAVGDLTVEAKADFSVGRFAGKRLHRICDSPSGRG